MLTDALTSLYASTAQTRRLAAVAVCAVFLMLLIAAAYLTQVVVFGAYSSLQDRRQHLGNLQLIVETTGASKDVALPAESENQTIFLRGNNKEIVGAELQNWIGQAAGEAGVELQSIENVPILAEKKQEFVGLSATLNGSWKAVQNLVLKVETAQPMLFIRDVDIQSNYYGEEENSEPQVTMHISFYGVLQSSGAKDGGG